MKSKEADRDRYERGEETQAETRYHVGDSKQQDRVITEERQTAATTKETRLLPWLPEEGSLQFVRGVPALSAAGRKEGGDGPGE